MIGFDIAVIVLVILVVLVLFSGIKTVPQGYNYTIERFGRYTRTLHPGLNLIVPFVDRVGARMNMMETVLDVPSQEVITRDNATVTANGVGFYQVLNAPQAAYEVNNLENAIINLTMTNIRSVMGSMDLDELLSNRDEINERLLRVVDAAAAPWGIKITRIEIKDIDPPRDLIDSMARQMKAEREKRATVLEAQGEREAKILRAEGEKQAQILEAEGRREAAFRDAEAREREAEAEAKATEMVSRAIGQGDMQAINYFVAQKYIEALAAFANSANQKTFLMPVEASAVIGALGGIGEIARQAFSGDPARDARPARAPGRVPASPAAGPLPGREPAP
ncbi:SPFH domain-containing protein [Faunimonas sp. B44]|uniref:SPFH domain-containing protein n=1 Tax=Faunimonas sp. B44 TaxID=3461493 RepID=UPI0040443132